MAITDVNHPSLVLFYDGSVSGTTVLDQSPNGLDGVIKATISDVDIVPGYPILGGDAFHCKAYNFSEGRLDSGIDIPDNVAFDSMLDSFTLSFWVKFRSDPEIGVVVGKYASNNGHFQIFQLNGKLYFRVYPDGTHANRREITNNTTDYYDDGQWHHICARFEGGTKLAINIDDQGDVNILNDVTLPATVFDSTHDIGIARNAGAGSLAEEYHIQNFRMFNVSVTDAEVTDLYNESGGVSTLPVHSFNDLSLDIPAGSYQTIESPLVLRQSHSIPAIVGISSSNRLVYDILGGIRLGTSVLYDITNTEDVQTSNEVRSPLVLGNQHEISVHILDGVKSFADLGLGMWPSLFSAYPIDSGLSVRDPLTSSYTIHAGMVDDSASVVSLNTSVHILVDPVKLAKVNPGAAIATAGGNTPFYYPVEYTSVSIDMTEGDSVWSCSVELANKKDYRLALPSFGLRVVIGGDTYDFLIDGYSNARDGSSPDLTTTILGVTNTANFDNPRHQSVTRSWENPTTASAIVSDLLPGVSVDWRIIDWMLPGSRVALENGSPISLASSLVQAVGAVLEPDMSGGFVVRYTYPAKTIEYPDRVDHYIEVVENVFTISRNYALGDFYNKFRISEITADYIDVIEFEEDENEKTQGKLRVYPSPWSARVFVTHTSDSTVSLTGGLASTQQLTEVVEILHGSGSVSKPIETLDGVTWLTADLSGIVFSQGSSDIQSTDPDKKYSLCEITYTTRFIEYDVSSPVHKDVQFLVNRPEE